ncbi:cbb3-type cytochrome oxidase assembly protein CcoS [Pseudidiomarina halophila]|uniref:Cbb3-type cytochrome oxidase assembly protein CcoS n=1 Tax=Pseudidiomarina halophila TaxID=1449799 RepID=A0A432Y0H1_9GAMM|nr:cbb3-type cytochrome oxidase assembly protein CcoS [Pseudidiomarina halophila]RUO54438.1 cbb3-type cytochrome oxidase assembly protein CcoS [Pseudidiomarina halophila]
MESLYILIPIAILFVIIAVAVFFWAVRSDQFEDLERQGMNVLLDDDAPDTSEHQAKDKAETHPTDKQKKDES